MKKFVFLGLCFSCNLILAQSLYLGNNNVSCGRYTLTENSNINDVINYCTILNDKTKRNGNVILKIKTVNSGVVKCKFINGQLDKCHEDD